MKFDDLLVTLGEFGPSQKRLYILLSLPAIQTSAISMGIFVFLFAVPEHRCAIPGLNNDTFNIQNQAHAALINVTIPYAKGSNGDLEYSPCLVFQTSTSASSGYMHNNTETCHKWIYDQTVYQSTAAQSMDLVCDRKLYVSHAKMAAFVGQLIGVLISGPLSDMFGRRKVILVAMFIGILHSICLPWVTNFYLFLAIILVITASFNTQYLTTFVFSMEIVGPSKRMLVGVAKNLFWSAGNAIVALSVYLLRDWKIRQLVVSIPGVMFVYLYFLPESPRWLYSRGRVEEANKMVMKMAKANKVKLLEHFTYANNDTDQQFWELLKSPIMVKRILIILYAWFAIGMGFYGLSMNVTNLSGNVYLNFFLFVLLEACAYVICLLLMGRIGRKTMLCASMLTAGATCILTFVPFLAMDEPNKWIINSLACLGNTCVSAGFASVYVFTAELLPTTSRNFGMAMSSVFCRIGSLSSPYINDLTMHISGRYSQILPMLVFGGVTALSGLLVLLLPETKSTTLPETIKEAEELGTAAHDDGTTRGQDTILLDRKDDC
ncbi:organic cation transporter protein-like [Haliotis cracherodii]|uniref:organic cation transporter protein-like n=1 Tax=Haliotis cracherodii TaxID=6455 RepID=UPI0039EAD343